MTERINTKDVLWENLIKPCRILEWCPYGHDLVELYPHTTTKEQARKYEEKLLAIITTGKESNGEKVNDKMIKFYESRFKSFNPEEYPETVSKEDKKIECRMFMHHCPAYYLSENVREIEYKVTEDEIDAMETELMEK